MLGVHIRGAWAGAHLTAQHVQGNVDPALPRTVHWRGACRLAKPGARLECVQAAQQVPPVPGPAWVMAESCA